MSEVSCDRAKNRRKHACQLFPALTPAHHVQQCPINSLGVAVIRLSHGFNQTFHFPQFQALQMDGTSIAGHEIKVSLMRPMTETVLVVRMYGHPDKLTDKEIKAAFGDVGLIRSIKPMLRKKKTMGIY